MWLVSWVQLQLRNTAHAVELFAPQVAEPPQAAQAVLLVTCKHHTP